MPISTEEQTSDEMKAAFSFSSFHSGLLKLAVLKILSVRPMHGYALIKEIERMSGGTWKPSPGSIYPALEALLRSGVISQEVVGRKRVYELTPQGNEMLALVMEHAKMAVKSMQALLDYKPTDNT
jgi:DNA-binding PadR family transcriptional regulator